MKHREREKTYETARVSLLCCCCLSLSVYFLLLLLGFDLSNVLVVIVEKKERDGQFYVFRPLLFRFESLLLVSLVVFCSRLKYMCLSLHKSVELKRASTRLLAARTRETDKHRRTIENSIVKSIVIFSSIENQCTFLLATINDVLTLMSDSISDSAPSLLLLLGRLK